MDELGLINLDVRGESCLVIDVYYVGLGGSYVGYGGFGFFGELLGGKWKDLFGLVFCFVVFGKVGYVGWFFLSCISGFGGGILNLMISGMF